jgi:hypothetical protein
MIETTAINTSGLIGVNIEKKDSSRSVVLVFISVIYFYVVS